MRPFALVFALALALPAAAVPLQLTHQGRLADSSGVPLEGAHQLSVAIFAEATGGSALWTDTVNAELDAGAFSIVLGAGAAALDAELFDGTVRYVELSIDDGAPLPQRLPLTSVPYAVRSGYAAMADTAAVADALSAPLAWSDITGAPADSDTLASLACEEGEVPTFDGSDWGCASPSPATVDVSTLTGTIDVDNLPVGTGTGTVAAGDHTHSFGQITGQAAYSQLPVGTTANTVAAGDHTHTAAEVGALPIGGGTLTGGLAVNGAVKVGTQTLTCNTSNAGSLRFVSGVLELCDGDAWVALMTSYGRSQATALASCKAILDASPGRVASSGTYWVDPDGGSTDNAVETTCDMTTDGGGWTRFWWFNPNTVIASGTDMLGATFGSCEDDAPACYAKLPAQLVQNDTQLLARDATGTVYRWQFNASNSTAAAAWRAFHDGTEVPSGQQLNGATWNPTVIAGAFHGTAQDSFMYRVQNGVKSFLMDDDNCDCLTTLSAGHGMCRATHDTAYGAANVFGVDILNDGACRGPVPANGLQLYFR